MRSLKVIAFLARAVPAAAILWSCGCRPRRVEGTVPLQLRGTTAVRVRDTQSGQLIRVREGRFLAVHLPADGKAGRWELVEKPDASILRIHRHGRGVIRGRDVIVTGDIIFYFEARRPGITSFALERAGGPESIGKSGDERELPENRGDSSRSPFPRCERFELAVDVYY